MNEQVSDVAPTCHVDDPEEGWCRQGVVVGYGTNRPRRRWWWNRCRRQGTVVGHSTDRLRVRRKETDAAFIRNPMSDASVTRRVDGDGVTDVDFK